MDIDAVHGDPPLVALEGPLFILSGYRLHWPAIPSYQTDLFVDEPLGHAHTGARGAFVILDVVFHPELAVTGMKEHYIALPRLLDRLARQSRLYVLGCDHIAERQALSPFEG